MKIAIGADEKTDLTDFVVSYVANLRHEPRLFGALACKKETWSKTARFVSEDIKAGKAQEGILLCWTGTGVCLVANKVPTVRAVLCVDSETARGARLWNKANVLCLSLRKTTEAVAKEVLDMWFKTKYVSNAEDNKAIDEIKQIEKKYMGFDRAQK
tara:strand:+ start:12741 stop:13208 length:468 start_codon:yes stop_codon:yes gene_type:complete